MIEELLDLVDEKDQVVGQITRSQLIANNLWHQMRAVWLFIVNDQGQLWIPRRTAHKKLFPNALDGSAVGAVSSGESYEQAIIRETMEELNLDLSQHKYRSLGNLSPMNDGLRCFSKVYELKSNDVPRYNQEDFCSYYWLTPEEILQRIESGEPSKGDLPKIIRTFYLNK